MTEPTSTDQSTSVDGAELLNRVKEAVETFVVCGEHEVVAITLHVAATHGQPAWHHATRLQFTSPEKRCGKSRAQDIHAELSYHPLITSNISVAALVRMIDEDDPPTLHLDEADAVFGRKAGDAHEDLRGILNAGFQRGRPYVRWQVHRNRTEVLPTFCMATLAGIGQISDTIEDRAIQIHMKRRGPHDRMPQAFRIRRDRPKLRELHDELHEYIRAHLHELAEAEPVMPVDDRDADKWEPLIAVADLAGGDWPMLARRACKEMCSGADDGEDDAGRRLLADLWLVFGGRDGAEAMRGSDIIQRLWTLEESGWSTYGKSGRGVTGADIASLLKDYGVKSRQARWADGSSARGYFRYELGKDATSTLADAWDRYCRECHE